MKRGFCTLFLCFVWFYTYSQDIAKSKLGDLAHPLSIIKWIKGDSVESFKKGQIYVIEFWATWCRPCMASMPKLSKLANTYPNVQFLGINIFEKEDVSIEKIKIVVDKMGNQMDFRVAIANNDFMEKNWFDAFMEQGIPKAFIVNTEGLIAWIGHPKDLDRVLSAVVQQRWSIEDALKKNGESKYVEELSNKYSFDLRQFFICNDGLYCYGKPDSALLMIDEAVRNEPRLKNSPLFATFTFAALLRKNFDQAYDFGNKILTEYPFEECGYAIINNLKTISNYGILPAKIYSLAAKAYQKEVDLFVYPEIMDLYRPYKMMAEWYWRANEKANAINAQQKAISFLKDSNNFSNAELKEYESSLIKYQSM